MVEVVFQVEEAPEVGFTARALGYSIHAQHSQSLLTLLSVQAKK